MKNIKLLKALAASALLAGIVISACSCNSGSAEPTKDTQATPTDAPTQEQPAEKVPHTVSIKTAGGKAVSGITFHVYEGDDLVAYGVTDYTGTGTASMVPGGDYSVKFTLPDSYNGYDLKESYPFDGTNASIVLTSAVIADSNITNARYKLGDIMHDFEITTLDDTTLKLSTLLETKKAILINFWYVGCKPCVGEFPYLQSAYEQYSDDVEILALNVADNELSIQMFKEDKELSFILAKDTTELTNAFGVSAYPTSIMIDRYGAICLIEVGAVPSDEPLVNAFEYFTADDYQQDFFKNFEDIPKAE